MPRRALLSLSLALGLGCAATPHEYPLGPPPEPPRRVAGRFYCGYGDEASFLTPAPEGVIPIDLDPSATTQACQAAQRRLDGPPADHRAADDALRRVCLARRCALWRVVAATADRDIVRHLCTRARLQQLDELASSVAHDGATLSPAELDARDAALARAQADDCVGMWRAGNDP